MAQFALEESPFEMFGHIRLKSLPPGETVFSFIHRINSIMEARCRLDESLPLLTMSKQIPVEFSNVIKIGLLACMAFHAPLI